MGTHKIYSGIQGIRDNISGSLYGDCHELLALPTTFTGNVKAQQMRMLERIRDIYLTSGHRDLFSF